MHAAEQAVVAEPAGSGADQFSHFRMDGRQAPIEGSQPPPVRAGQRRQVGVRHLAVPDDATQRHPVITEIVWPETVPFIGGDLDHEPSGIGGRRTFPHQEPQQHTWVMGQVAKAPGCRAHHPSAARWWTWSTTVRAMRRLASSRWMPSASGIVLERPDVVLGDGSTDSGRREPGRRAAAELHRARLPKAPADEISYGLAQCGASVAGDAACGIVQVPREIDGRSHVCIITRSAS